MKKNALSIELKKLPEELQKRILGLIRKDLVEIVCINEKAALHLTIVTVVLTKYVTADKKQQLQNDVLAKQLYQQHNLVVCYGTHSVFPYESDFNTTYLALNMHPKFMVYSRTENLWQALFQNHYSFTVGKQRAGLEKYVAETVEHHQRTMNLFVTPLLKNNQFAAVGLICVQLLRNYLTMLETLLFANGTAVVRSEQEMLVFLKDHHTDLYRIFVKEDADKLYFEMAMNEDSVLLFNKKDTCSRLQKVLENVKATFAPIITSYFGKQLEEVLKPFDGHRVFTRNSYAELVRQQVAQHLANGFGVSLIYHIEMKHNSGNMELVLFLVVSAVTPYLEQRMVSEVANKFGSTIKVTLMLHRMGWISKHGYAHLPFIYNNITHEKLLFAKKDNTHAKFIFPVFEIPDGCFDRAQYGQYWDSCRENLQLQWQQISDVANSTPSSAHVTVLCRIFITLCHACVYRTACYLPHLRNPQYALKMLQWAQPDYVQLHITDNHVAEIFTLFEGSSLEPSSEKNDARTIYGSRFAAVLQICSGLYEHAERLFNE